VTEFKISLVFYKEKIFQIKIRDTNIGGIRPDTVVTHTGIHRVQYNPGGTFLINPNDAITRHERIL
jgi:hypothetical protein